MVGSTKSYSGCIKALNDNEEALLAEIQRLWLERAKQKPWNLNTGTFNKEKGYIDYKKPL